jgi:hypothetical protein
MKATTKDIKFYKGVILIEIHNKLCHDGDFMSIEELDNFLKDYADLTNESCSDLNHWQMQQLKEYCKQFACSIGMGEDALDNDKTTLKF